MRTTWFDLARHDDPVPAPEPTPAPTPDPVVEPPADPAPVDPAPATKPNGPNGFPESTPLAEMSPDQQASYWKFQSRKHEATAKANADKAKKFDDIEDANKTEAERLAAKAEAAEAKADAATKRAVKAEIKSLATDFADPTDAESAVDAAKFVDDNGEIDTEGIKARLAEILETKPHWRKTTPAPTPTPRPDPGQGPRPTPAATNFKDADKATFAAELAKYGVRPKSS